MKQEYLERGRGATKQVDNPFSTQQERWDADYLEHCHLEDEPPSSKQTQFIKVYPKSIFSKNSSEDISFNWSINPYQGCEHGCVYCYARNSHEYWGYNAGLDFEKVILVKQNIKALIRAKLSSRTWKPEMVMLSGNTDCYQPIERKLGLTRQILESFLHFKHPLGVITKNALIQRDIDILSDLAKEKLVRVVISLTTLNEELRRKMEPRTASVKQRLKTIEALVSAGIPVAVNAAPIIPGLNSHEIFDLVKASAEAGAHDVNYIMVRLNGRVAEVFDEWLKEAFPDRKNKIINQIRETRRGKLNDSRWKVRMRGDGTVADHLASTFKIAKQRYMPNANKVDLDYSLYTKRRDGGEQTVLW